MRIIASPLADSLAGVNFAYGRGECPYPIDAITIHVTEGSAASVRSWFANPGAQVSAHYLVTKAGAVEQFVDEDDKAFHAGQLVRPTAPLVLARQPWSPNSWAIGVECEGSGTEELTDAQRTALYSLLVDIIQRRGIPVDREHIFGHREVKASKTCPGKIDVDRIVADLALIVVRPADYPRLVYSPQLGDYLVVTKYIDNDTWYFVPVSQITGGQRAGTPLSAMPTEAL